MILETCNIFFFFLFFFYFMKYARARARTHASFIRGALVCVWIELARMKVRWSVKSVVISRSFFSYFLSFFLFFLVLFFPRTRKWFSNRFGFESEYAKNRRLKHKHKLNSNPSTFFLLHQIPCVVIFGLSIQFFSLSFVHSFVIVVGFFSLSTHFHECFIFCFVFIFVFQFLCIWCWWQRSHDGGYVVIFIFNLYLWYEWFLFHFYFFSTLLFLLMVNAHTFWSECKCVNISFNARYGVCV